MLLNKAVNFQCRKSIKYCNIMRLDNLIKLLLGIAAISVFYSVCNYEFLDWDDGINISENPFLNPTSLQNVLYFWQNQYEGFYIPLTYTVWAIVALVSQNTLPYSPEAKLEPHLFHSANLILHILNVLLVFVILRLFINKACITTKNIDLHNARRLDWAAGCGALLFAFHPVQVESVSWATGTKDLLCAFFSLTALWQYFLYATLEFTSPETNGKKETGLKLSKKKFRYILASSAFIAALLAKPAAVILPIVAWVLDVLIVRKSTKNAQYH